MKRYLTWAVIGALVLWAGSQAFHFYRVTVPDRTHTMIDAVEDMQTFCIGRFLIDLPRGTKITVAMGTARGAHFSAESPVSRAKFGWKVKDRWAEVEPMKADSYDKPYVEPSKRLEPAPDAVVFAYEHVLVSGPDAFGVDLDRVHARNEGYPWRDNVLYSFTDLAAVEQIVDTMRILQVLPDGEIPNEPGFCGPRSFSPGGTTPESVTVAFELPTKPAFGIRFLSSTYPSDDARKGFFPARFDPTLIQSDKFKLIMDRDAKRTVTGMAGEEFIEGSTSTERGSVETLIQAEWRYSGEPKASGAPAMRVRGTISYETDEPPSPWGDFPHKSSPNMIDKEAFMAYWDTILDTLRPRPGALPAGDK